VSLGIRLGIFSIINDKRVRLGWNHAVTDEELMKMSRSVHQHPVYRTFDPNVPYRLFIGVVLPKSPRAYRELVIRFNYRHSNPIAAITELR